MRCLKVVLILFFTFGCALPVPEGAELGTFVPDDEILLVSLARDGMSAFNQSRFLEADIKFRQALFIKPSLPNMRLNLAATLDKEGLFKEAEVIFLDLVKELPEYIPYLSGLAHIYLDSGDYQSAMKYYQQALNLAFDLNDVPQAQNTLRSLSVISFKYGYEQEALCYAEWTNTLAPNKPDFIKYVRLLIGVGRNQEALTKVIAYSTDQSLEKDPELLHYRAEALFGLGKFKEAEELEALAMLTGSGEAELQSQMSLVRSVARELTQGETDLTDKEKDAREKFLKTLVDMSKTGSISMFYWPRLLVEKVYELAAKEEEKEEG